MRIFLTKEAYKQYLKLKQSNRNKIEKKISFLILNPFAGKKLTGEYKNIKSLRAWPFRIIYFINERQKEVWIVSIIHRQGAYK